MTNLLDVVKEQFSPTIMSGVASLIGAGQEQTSSAVQTVVPSLLSGILDLGSTDSGAKNIMNLIGDNNLNDSFLGNIGDLLGGGAKSEGLLSMGAGLMTSLFGNNQSTLVNQLLNLTGLNKGTMGKLLSIVAPIALSSIGKFIKSDNLSLGGLMSFFTGQKSNVAAALPAGFAAMSSGGGGSTTASSDDDSGSGMGWLKWLIPLLLLALLAWYFMNRGKGDNYADGDYTEVSGDKDQDGHKVKEDALAGHAHDAKSSDEQAGHTHGSADKKSTSTRALGYRLDAKGNIVDKYNFIVFPANSIRKDAKGNIVDAKGNILIPAAKVKGATVKTTGTASAQLTVDANGNLVDANGKVLFKKGDFKSEGNYYVDKEGNRIGFFKKVGQAIGNAAEATADAFKSVFTGIFAKKEKVGSTYDVTRMEFNKENHRLTYYSKHEIEGLVAALKANPNSKIQVRVHTNDGKNEKENKQLTDLRANVVRDMMTTLLGTNKNQISFKGMGSGNAAKAAKDAVEVYVEK